MAPKKKSGQKALDHAKQRIEEKLAKVREERGGIRTCHEAVSALCADIVAPQTGCIAEQGVKAVECAFAEIEKYVAQLKAECLKTVDDVAASSQGRLSNVQDRLLDLEDSMVQAEKKATDLCAGDPSKFLTSFPSVSRKLEECLDESVILMADCSTLTDGELPKFSCSWHLDVDGGKTKLKGSLVPRCVFSEAWSDALSAGSDAETTDSNEEEQRQSVASSSSVSSSADAVRARKSRAKVSASEKVAKAEDRHRPHQHQQQDQQPEEQLEQQQQQPKQPKEEQEQRLQPEDRREQSSQSLSRVSACLESDSTRPSSPSESPMTASAASDLTSSVCRASDSTSSVCRAPAATSYSRACIRLVQGNQFSGQVIEATNPHDFWVQLGGPQLDWLMEHMSGYYMNGAVQQVTLPAPGMLCAAQFSLDLKWYRAMILYVSPDRQCSVLYVDYGNAENVPLERLAQLHPDFHQLHYQCIHCQLSKVQPRIAAPDQALEWPEAASEYFSSLVAGHDMSCLVVGREDTRFIPTHKVHMELKGGQTERDVGACLVTDAHAMFTNAAQRELKRTIEILSSDQMDSANESRSSARGKGQPSAAAASTTTQRPASESPSGTAPIAGGDQVPLTHSPALTVLSPPPASAGSASVDQLVASSPAGAVVSRSPKHHKSRAGRLRGKRKDPPTLAPDAPTSDASGELSPANNAAAVRMITAALHSAGKSSVESHSASHGPSTLAPGADTSYQQQRLGSIECDSEASGDRADSEGSVDDVTDASVVSYQPPRLPVDEDGVLKVMLQRVVDPSEIYVHVVAEEPVRQLNTVTDLLSAMSSESSVDQFVPRICQPCCAQFSKDDLWYRAVCVGMETGGEGPEHIVSVRVHYVDYGEAEDTPLSRIRSLPDNLRHFPMLSVRCSLAVLDLPGDDDDGNAASGLRNRSVWADDASTVLKEYVDNGRVLIARLVAPDGDSSNQDKSSVAYYYRTSSSRPWLHSIKAHLIDTSVEDLHLNLHLRRERFELDKMLDVKSKSDFSSKALSEPVVRQALASWDPMQEDFAAMTNSYGVDMTNAGQAVVGYGKETSRPFCRNFLSSRGCFRENCHFLHERPGLVTNDTEYVFCHNHDIVLPSPGQWVAVVLSVILDVDRYWIQLPHGARPVSQTGYDFSSSADRDSGMAKDEDLESMTHRMHKRYKNMKYGGDMILKACGELVAARYSTDGNWYRAQVMLASEEQIEVFFVDFGNTSIVTQRDIRSLDPEFTHIPFQAVECFLGNVRPQAFAEAKPAEGDPSLAVIHRWHPQARMDVQKLTWGKVLIAKVLARQATKQLTLDLFSVEADGYYVNIGTELVSRGYAKHAEKPIFPLAPAAATSSGSHSTSPKGTPKTMLVPG